MLALPEVTDQPASSAVAGVGADLARSAVMAAQGAIALSMAALPVAAALVRHRLVEMVKSVGKLPATQGAAVAAVAHMASLMPYCQQAQLWAGTVVQAVLDQD